MEEVDADWRRILDFFRAFVPVLPLELPGLDLVTRKRALRRFKPHAARGVDGISHHDLLALPDAWTERLLELLGNIELLTAGHILGGCQRDC